MDDKADKRKDDETVSIKKSGSHSDRLDETVDIDRVKLNQETIKKIAEILADKYPPGSEMYQWITGFEVLGGRTRKHILSIIYTSIPVGIPGIILERIRDSIFEIIRAYKKATEDVTHLIDVEKS